MNTTRSTTGINTSLNRHAPGATHIVCVMSGNFTQRGDCAVYDKHLRARTALENGADLVLELPTRYSLSAAEGFAAGAVRLISALGCVDMLSFGSESGSIPALKEASAASDFAINSDRFAELMRMGKSYPAALAQVVQEYYTPDVYETLSCPNNTLAVEYLSALDNIGSRIEPFTVQRLGAAHCLVKSVGKSVRTVVNALEIIAFHLPQR